VDALFTANGTGTSVGLNVGAGKTLAVAGTLVVTGAASTIDATAIGATTPDTGAFTTVSASSRVNTDTLNNAANSASIILRTGATTVVGNSASALVVTDTANVGIGTTSPSQRLSLQGSSTTYALAETTGTGTSAGFRMKASASADYTLFTTQGVNQFAIYDNAAGSQRVTLESSGNVGIGSTSVTSKLDVVSTSGTYSGGIRVNGTTTGNTSSGMYIVGCQGTTHYNWLLGSQFNLSNAFEITPSTAANGTTFSTPRFVIDIGGTVTMSAYGAGTATFSASGVISSVSDETWKIKDGIPVDPDSMLKKLEPGYWYYNDEKKEIFGVDRQLGFYAQNVNAAIGPEAAPTPEEGKPWGYYDRSVLAVTVMSLQKALATIESLTARITALEST